MIITAGASGGQLCWSEPRMGFSARTAYIQTVFVPVVGGQPSTARPLPDQVVFGPVRSGQFLAAGRVPQPGSVTARDSPAGCPGPRDLGGPWGQEQRSGPGPAPGQARGAQARRGGRLRDPDAREQGELAFDKQKKEKNYTNPGPGTGSGNLITAEPPGGAASHRTRCA